MYIVLALINDDPHVDIARRVSARIVASDFAFSVFRWADHESFESTWIVTDPDQVTLSYLAGLSVQYITLLATIIESNKI